jgi:trehalose 6-phosphate phosphatase
VTPSPLAALAARPERAGILLDFDGTLAPIVSRPEDAGPAAGAHDVLMALVDRYAVVAIVSGRPAGDLLEMLDVKGVRYEGLYGLPAGIPPAGPLLGRVEFVAKAVPGAWVEAKGITVAVHYRQAEDHARSREVLAAALRELSDETGYDLLEGKMVFELAPAGESRKGGAVERLVRGAGLAAAMYAGDDLPDLEAFAALDRMEEDGLETVKVAVGGIETPEALRADADVVVEGPVELLELLRRSL